LKNNAVKKEQKNLNKVDKLKHNLKYKILKRSTSMNNVLIVKHWKAVRRQQNTTQNEKKFKKGNVKF